MEVLAALGIGAKELFNYNRENFRFDQDQRIERETLRLEMQVKRFELFREDVRDLVELTVDRMDVYHLVGALFLEFCIVLFCEGRVQAAAPPYLLSLFLLSNACAFIYLLLAVWLSMHASIASHSFGVRLLTRFVRLPIPSVKQMNHLRSQLRDYEQQGLANMLRLPFLGSQQEWNKDKGKGGTNGPAGGDVSAQTAADLAAIEADFLGQSASASNDSPLPRVTFAAQAASSGGAASKADAKKGSGSPERKGPVAPPPAASGAGGGLRGAAKASAPSDRNLDQVDETALLPEEDVAPIGGEALLSGGRGATPERHVQLFRQLQSKWQCYDAYCRVCMGLGVNQILQGLSYYSICYTLVENRSPTIGYAMVMLFQATTVALAVLDLAGLKRREIIAVQVVGMMPCLMTAFGVASGARDEKGVLDPDENYMLSPLSFLFQVLWLELWICVASPTGDQASLPRRFRQVLFLDVFGDAVGWDPTQAEADPNSGGPEEVDVLEAEAEQELDKSAQEAASQLALAQCAMRRWEAVPSWSLSTAQHQKLGVLRKQMENWGDTTMVEVERRNAQNGALDAPPIFEVSMRRWQSLSPEDRQSEPFARCLLGAFEHDDGTRMATFHYDIDNGKCIFSDDKEAAGQHVLTLEALGDIMADLETKSRALLELRIMRDLKLVTARQEAAAQRTRPGSDDDIQRSPLKAMLRRVLERFPTLVSLLREHRLFRTRRGRSSTRDSLIANQELPPTTAPSTAGLSSAAGSVSVSSSSTAQLPESGAPRRRTPIRDDHLEKDPTLVAMAGQDAKHFVPERLPWQVLSRMTRVLQFAWGLSGLMALLKELGVYQVDFQQHPGHEGRRLCSNAWPSGSVPEAACKTAGGASAFETWRFSRVEVEWPHGALFRPQALVCSSQGLSAVASPFGFYRARPPREEAEGGDATAQAATQPSGWGTAASSGARFPGSRGGGQPWRLEELRRLRLPATTVAFCQPALHALGASSLERCLLAAPSPEGLKVWSGVDATASNVTTLEVDGPAWTLVSGTVVRCRSSGGGSQDRDPRTSRLLSALISDEELADAEWCLLLVGWDGELLPVAAVPLPAGPGTPPPPGTRVLPAFDAPLQSPAALLAASGLPQLPAGGSRAAATGRFAATAPANAVLSEPSTVVALHLEPSAQRLWALRSTGDLQAWDFVALRRLGTWRSAWPEGDDGFRPVALCEASARGELLVAGRDASGPVLYSAPADALAAATLEQADIARGSFLAAPAGVIEVQPDLPTRDDSAA